MSSSVDFFRFESPGVAGPALSSVSAPLLSSGDVLKEEGGKSCAVVRTGETGTGSEGRSGTAASRLEDMTIARLRTSGKFEKISVTSLRERI